MNLHALLLWGISVRTRSIIISQSQVTECVRSDSGLACSLKLLLNAVVTTGSTGTDAVVIESVVDGAGNQMNLASPISIQVSKAAVFVRYSLEYVGDVNSQPVEVIGATSVLACSSGISSIAHNPTCGSLFYNGKVVKHSEGYCCTCSLDQMLGLSRTERGNAPCNLLSGFSSNGASVHCLRWGTLWYSLFNVMTPSVHSTVYVTSDQGLNITVNAEKPAGTDVINATLNVTASLIGSFQWSRPPTDWGQSSMAACPNIPGSPNVAPSDIRVSNYDPKNPFRYGLLVSKERVDLTGDTCNKIGVSYSAFANNQGNRCSGNVGDCLNNQLDNLWVTSKPENMIHYQLCASIGGEFVENEGYRLSCVLSDSASDIPTQVLIALNADRVLLVRNSSYGVIVNVTTSTDIEALTQHTTVGVLIENTGNLTSQYNVAIQNCSSKSLICPLQSTVLSLLPKELKLVDIKIEDSDVSGGNYSCTAVLADSEGIVLSSMSFTLNISATSTDRGSQESGATEGDYNSSSTSQQSSGSGCEACGGFFSVLCFISHECWSGLGSLFGALGGIGVFLALMTKFGGWTLMWSLLKCLCGSCCKSRKQQKRRNSDTEQMSAPYFYPATNPMDHLAYMHMQHHPYMQRIDPI